MWYWGENGRRHVSKIIAAGAENQHVPELLGWDRATSLAEAIADARSHHRAAPPRSRCCTCRPFVIPEVE